MRKIPEYVGLAGTATTRLSAPGHRGVERALDRAMQVFRAKGFHAASVTNLAASMGLTVGSIYKAFNDKQTLFFTGV